jgi:ATP-dependent RNA helicase SUPV3L1/SUV3
MIKFSSMVDGAATMGARNLRFKRCFAHKSDQNTASFKQRKNAPHGEFSPSRIFERFYTGRIQAHGSADTSKRRRKSFNRVDYGRGDTQLRQFKSDEDGHELTGRRKSSERQVAHSFASDRGSRKSLSHVSSGDVRNTIAETERKLAPWTEDKKTQALFPWLGSLQQIDENRKTRSFENPGNIFEKVYNQIKEEGETIYQDLKEISDTGYRVWRRSTDLSQLNEFSDNYMVIKQSFTAYIKVKYPDIYSKSKLERYFASKVATLQEDIRWAGLPQNFDQYRESCRLDSNSIIAEKNIIKGFDLALVGHVSLEEYHALSVAGLFKGFVNDGLQRAGSERIQQRTASIRPTEIRSLSTPAKHYPKAREISRKVILHIGPTNSGKTYNALQAFQRATSGFYAGPLRLLAREVYNHMKAAKRPCNLVTGEEVIEELDTDGKRAKLSSGTVEMMNIKEGLDVAVIDEIQMIGDPERGWAWTQAFLGVRAKEVHICGDPSSEDIIRRLVSETGDSLEIKRYERLGKLSFDYKNPVVGLDDLRPGDCLVFFSKTQILATKAAIEKHTGDQCAVIYGQLPAEIRSKQAAEFNNPNSNYKYMVASDAIGMGLNLAIRRVVLSTVSKFDGKKMTRIPVAQIKQIAGRAGRYKVAPDSQYSDTEPAESVGLVSVMDRRDKGVVQRCLTTDSPLIHKARVFPTDVAIKNYASAFPNTTSLTTILSTLSHSGKHLTLGDSYTLCSLDNMIEISEIFEAVPGLLLEEQLTLSKAPVSLRHALVKRAFKEFCYTIARSQSMSFLDMKGDNLSFLFDSLNPSQQVDVRALSDSLESLSKTLELYLWLSYRFPSVFLDREGVMQLKQNVGERINSLISASSSRLRRKYDKKKAIEGAAGYNSL